MSQLASNDTSLILEAYKILVKLLESEDSLFWRRNEVLLAINGGMITILAFFRSSQPTPIDLTLKVILSTICIIGLVTSLLWLLIVKRTEAFYNHWYEQLKQLEKQYLSPINIFQIADEYFAKRQIKLGQETFKLDLLAGSMRMFRAIQVVSTVFAIIWLVLGIFLFLYS